MNELILLGQGTQILTMPQPHWQAQLASAPAHIAGRLDFMSATHHQVRYFVVSELPRLGRPLPPHHIAEKLGLPLRQVNAILDELERHLFFLSRTKFGDVAWAYPVTADTTPHQVTFSSGEQLFAA